MNLKKSILSFMAAGAILAGGFGSVGAQAITTTGTVVVNGSGSFVPRFCNPVDLHSGTVTSATGATTTGSVDICVVDDIAYRDEQNLHVRASTFTTEEHNGTFSGDNLKITKTYNPGQARYSSHVCGPVNQGGLRPCVGDAAGIGESGLRVTGGNGEGWDIPGSLGGNGLKVLHFWNGSGTSATVGKDGTIARFDVALTIPAAQRPATYTTTLTLDVNPTNP